MAMVCVTGGRECDGCSRCFKDDPVYTCPVCGTELDSEDRVYMNDCGEIFGCEYCINIVRAHQALGD